MDARTALLGKKKTVASALPHRVDSGGVKYWLDGEDKHRVEGPAVLRPDGSEEWWLYGSKHREDGPAITEEGRCEYWQHGVLHRTDGPAVTKGERREYWQHGVLHRIDGPAIIDTDRRGYWRDGKNLYTVLTHDDQEVIQKEYPRGVKTLEKQGMRFHYKKDRLHRSDGPAIESLTPDAPVVEKFYLEGVCYELEEWERKAS